MGAVNPYLKCSEQQWQQVSNTQGAAQNNGRGRMVEDDAPSSWQRTGREHNEATHRPEQNGHSRRPAMRLQWSFSGGGEELSRELCAAVPTKRK
ncbi:hypothetical protein SESBI_00660 [Sesbania bispinosa]|nr:hypothetical protein SESBI_00660 [Sesbania bispinosa]